MRNKSQTIGTLGRAPARSGRPSAPPLPPPIDPPPEKSAVGGWLHGAFFENLGLKFLSMVLAVTVFLLVNTDKDREISADIGVSYTLPDDRVLVSERLDKVHITVKGPWRRLRRFDEHQLERINLDLRHTPTGDISITRDMFRMPAGLAITSITPTTLHVTFDRRGEKLVEIVPTVSTPPHGYFVAEIKVMPATVKIAGAESVINALTSIPTKEISLDNQHDIVADKFDLLPQKGVTLESNQKVNVTVHIEEKLVTRNLPGLAVTGVDPAKWALAPAEVEVTLTGALLAVETAQTKLSAVVKLPPEQPGQKPKELELPITIEGLPPGMGVKVSPERVKVTPIKPAPPAPPPTPPPAP